MKRSRLALLTATLMLLTVVGAAPALAGTNSLTWDYSGGRNLPVVGAAENIMEVLAVPDGAGAECVLEISYSNQRSTHPGNTLNVYLGLPDGSPLVSFDGFEDVPFGSNMGSAAFTATGEDLVVSILRPNDARISGKTSSSGTLTVTCEPPDNGGGEGCTPGYWKQEHHFDSWTGYSPSDSFVTEFGVDFGYLTLLDALKAKGGKENALARHATAALLNASSPDVSYEFTTGEIVALVQAADLSGDYNGAKNILEAENEAGCPLN